MKKIHVSLIKMRIALNQITKSVQNYSRASKIAIIIFKTTASE